MAQQRFVEQPQRFVAISHKVALGAAGALAVFVTYYPSDSVAVENGDGLWFAVLATAWATLVAAVHWLRPETGSRSGLDWIDLAAGGLATSMMGAAFLNSSQSDLRMGTNEAWWWVTAAAILIAARRTLSSTTVRQAILLLTACVTVGLAADAIHQDWISLPATRASYQADPDAIIAAMGIDAPPQSSTRMVLENRLIDGGPAATFALANSLAAVLLLGVVVIAGGLRLGWTQISGPAKAGLIACLVVLIPALIAVRSRAALIATLLGLAMLWMIDRGHDKTSDKEPSTSAAPLERLKRNRGLQALVGILGTAMAGMIGLAMFGNPEWFGQAPASLAFRLQYWAATWRLMCDHPLLGAGPGNFQSLYDRYRDVSTTEQIADPHNFLLETLSSGGPIALLLLLTVLFIAAKQLLGRRYSTTTEPAKSSTDPRTVLIGGAAMLGIIWFFGLLTLHTPDFSSHRFAIPVAIGLGWSVRTVFRQLNDQQLDRIYCVSLVSILVHLSVSGGWTVPGVAFWAWILVAGLTRIPIGSLPAAHPRNRSGWATSIGVLLLLLLTFVSVRPVGQQSWLMSSADASLRRGNIGKSTRVLAEAVEADPWSSKAPILQSGFLCREIIRQNNSSSSRRAYNECTQIVIDRAGPNPKVDEHLATQRLHLYQVFGKTHDLDVAEQHLQSAWRGSPANQWLVAQLAEIAIAKKSNRANELVQRAQSLSKMGNNLERFMELQLLYIAEPIGDRATQNPVRASAKERFLARPQRNTSG